MCGLYEDIIHYEQTFEIENVETIDKRYYAYTRNAEI